MNEATPPPADPIPPRTSEPTPPPPPPPSGPAPSPAKADIGKRLVAALIDGVISGVIGVAIPAIGGIIGAAYMLLRDGLEFDFMNHRSVGKHVMKLHLVSVDGQPLDISTSIKRNWMFAIGAVIPLLVFIPVLGWIAIPFVALAGIVLGVIELVLVLTDPEGRRIGDKMAGTRVAED